MPLPTSKAGLEAAGYTFDGDGRCKACGVPIEFWITPNNKRTPFANIEVRETDSPISPVKEFKLVSHFADCPEAGSFRRRK